MLFPPQPVLGQRSLRDLRPLASLSEGVGDWTSGKLELVIPDVLLNVGHDLLSADPLVAPRIAPSAHLMRQHAPVPVLCCLGGLDQDMVTLAGV